MKSNKLIILSRDAGPYLELIRQAKLPGLTIETGRNLNEGRRHLGECDIIFGTPALVQQALPHAPRLKWVQSMWAGVMWWTNRPWSMPWNGGPSQGRF